ncbi:hypothetical protein [Asanoa siamensis]|uniref:Dolichyl-phosphate-mannose-protein mannosyltransferase n=1 Tax=Asanoa siamensis TaxID=926357 RepID=A0ABQ4CJB1_9ACTN|nr:hypothetical protein [Asanoa siamensis]GIF71387.1 hypothetical protein Asi02nite_09050 [Asanoa siamensis]
MDGNITAVIPAVPAAGQETVDDRPAPRRGRWRRILLEALAPLALVVITFVIHDVPTAIRLPYWLDEAWVAASTRLPLHDLPTTTSSTPIGWSALLRLIPDLDWLRLLPIAFLVLSVLGGYALAAVLPWPSTVHRVVAGLVTGVAVALVPAQHLRHDLKQYTADAAVTLALLALAGFVEAKWSRKRLGLLLGAACVGVLISHTTTLVGGCVAGGLVLAALAKRQWRQALEATVTGAVMLVVFGLSYFGLAKGGDNAAMANYWDDYFPKVGELPGYIDGRATSLQPYLGTNWMLLLVLALAGIVTVGLLGRPAMAGAALLLLPAAVVAGVVRMYPLLDLRTSHFLLVWLVAFAAIGVAGIGTLVGRLLLARRSPAGASVVAAALAVALLGGYAYRTSDWFRFDGWEFGVRSPATSENTRQPVAFVWANRKPGDIVLVSGSASYGFATYWPAQPGYRLDQGVAVGWQPTYPDASIVMSTGRDAAAIHGAIVTATGMAAKAGPDAVVWVIRSHMNKTEKTVWKTELEKLTYDTTPTGGEAALRLTDW